MQQQQQQQQTYMNSHILIGPVVRHFLQVVRGWNWQCIMQLTSDLGQGVSQDYFTSVGDQGENPRNLFVLDGV